MLTFLCARVKMNNLFFWVLIGLLGFVLYISPGYFIHRMYESFAAAAAPTPTAAVAGAAAPRSQSVDATGTATVNLQASAAPRAATPTHNAIANLLEVLNTPPPTATPTPAPVAIGTNSGNSLPVEYETMRSRPESTRVIPGPSEAMKQGDLYNTTLPKIPQPGAQGMLGSMGTQARAPAERVVYIERERPEDDDDMPKPSNNPNCPDMREYIRKDSIPCWGCKLR